MSVFSYRAVRSDGQEVSGTLEVSDRSEALRRLSQQGLQPFSLESGKTATSDSRLTRNQPSGRSDPVTTGVRLKSKEVIHFTDELSDLLQAGLQLEPALKLMENRSEDSRIQAVAGTVRSRIRDGESMARALQAASPSFGALYCNLAAAGEQAGALDTILKRQVAYLTTLSELRGKVMTAMVYPSFLIVSGLVVTLLFVTFLIPRLMELIDATGARTPLVARMMMSMSEGIQQFWWLFLILGIAVAAGFRMLTTNPRFRPIWDREKLRIPLTGPLLSARFHVQFLETLSNLIANGLPLLNALELSRGTVQNLHHLERLDQIVGEVRDGASLAKSMDRSEIFPARMTDLIRIGEQTGKLQESLSKAAQRFEKELSVKIERLSAMIQPAIILLMAGLVGTMAWVMISTIYQTISLLQMAR